MVDLSLQILSRLKHETRGGSQFLIVLAILVQSANLVQSCKSRYAYLSSRWHSAIIWPLHSIANTPHMTDNSYRTGNFWMASSFTAAIPTVPAFPDWSKLFVWSELQYQWHLTNSPLSFFLSTLPVWLALCVWPPLAAGIPCAVGPNSTACMDFTWQPI